MNQAEFIEHIRQSEGLKNAVLNKICVDMRERVCRFEIVTDTSYSESDIAMAEKTAIAAVPAFMQAEVKIVKLVADAQLVRHKILEYLGRNHRAAAACIRAEDIDVFPEGQTVRFTFGVDADERGFFEKNEQLLPGVERMLEKNFCNTFKGELADKEKSGAPGDEAEEEEEEVFDYRPARTFPVEAFEPIDEPNVPKIATYLSDCNFTSDSLTVCGEIQYIQDRVSQKGKPYLRFTISDTTDRLQFSYFIRKKTEEKIRALKTGDWIVCTGANEMFNERLSFTARCINRGRAPQNFVPEKRPGKPAPAHYAKVIPEKLTDYSQLNLFEQSALPEDLIQNTFVVFDLETTGLVNVPAAGKMDAITEIGAVKIIGGEIREKFTTLVNPERKLDEEIVRITGITDEMVKDAPKIGEVIPDFYKFCDGCILVGHNVQFDYKFIQHYGAQEEYMFEQKTYDTLSIAQSMLFLPNYKLNTLADHYGIVFNHHRAWDDALTTAKIFIELIKAKKCLPKA